MPVLQSYATLYKCKVTKKTNISLPYILFSTPTTQNSTNEVCLSFDIEMVFVIVLYLPAGYSALLLATLISFD